MYYHFDVIRTSKYLAAFLALVCAGVYAASAQPPGDGKPRVRTVTLPISIFTRQELKRGSADEIVDVATLTVKEDKEPQEILSIRSVSDSPLSLAVLVQEELSSGVNLQLREIADFIRTLPSDSRVMVGYLRGPTVQVRQRFTTDLEKAAKSLRIVAGTPAANGPYAGLSEALKRFDALPSGRRAVILISDGYDGSQGPGPFSVTRSLELDKAIARAQRNGVAVYTIYSPTALTDGTGSTRALDGQSGLQRLSDETGGRSYFQGRIAPISLTPFLRDVTMTLGRQFALTYLSTHMKKGYHKVEITSSNPEVRIEHPKSYYYR